MSKSSADTAVGRINCVIVLSHENIVKLRPSRKRTQIHSGGYVPYMLLPYMGSMLQARQEVVGRMSLSFESFSPGDMNCAWLNEHLRIF